MTATAGCQKNVGNTSSRKDVSNSITESSTKFYCNIRTLESVETPEEKGMLVLGTAAVGLPVSTARPETFEAPVAEGTSTAVWRRQEQSH
jgi:hypothetical protein